MKTNINLENPFNISNHEFDLMISEYNPNLWINDSDDLICIELLEKNIYHIDFYDNNKNYGYNFQYNYVTKKKSNFNYIFNSEKVSKKKYLDYIKSIILY